MYLWKVWVQASGQYTLYSVLAQAWGRGEQANDILFTVYLCKLEGQAGEILYKLYLHKVEGSKQKIYFLQCTCAS